jgi:WXG100 family type VII secretion target
MAAAKVRADYEQLAEIARTFGRQSASTQTLLQSLTRQMQVLQGGDWVGKSADKFYAEMNSTLLPAIKRLGDALTRAQQVTRQVSRIMKDAENGSAALFKAVASGAAGEAGSRLRADTAGAPASAMQLLAAGLGLPLAGLGPLGSILKGLAVTLNPTILKSFAALNAAFPNLVKYFPGRWMFNSVVPNVARGNTTVAILMDMMAGRPGRGLWMLRFDGPHRGSPFPHLNLNPQAMRPGPIMRWLNPGLRNIPDPHLRIPPSMLEAGGRSASWLGKIGRAAPWLAAGIDVFRLGSAFHSDGNTIGANTARTAGSVAGGWAGAWAGAELGAAGGAAIGTLICPGVGTAIGGFIGGLGGAIAGGLGGSAIGEKIVSLFQ